MEVVAICGSPRAKGNTATLIETMLEGAREAGATVTRFDPAMLRIEQCTACDQCLGAPEDECVLQDDMVAVFAALKRADAWILGTPIYYNHVSGTLKVVIDRFYSFYTTQGGWVCGLRRGRRGAVTVVQADAGVEIPNRVADYLEEVLSGCNVQCVGRLAEPRLGGPTDAAARPDLLAKARELGRQLVA
jgi:multimeric flavodoxin WrbA